MKLIVAWLDIGKSANNTESALARCSSGTFVFLLNVSNNFWYKESVNNASGSSRKYDFNIPVTECISTSFSSCSAS